TGTVIQQKISVELQSAGFAVIHQDPRTINAVYESIRQLGTIFERSKEAEDLVLTMQQGFNGVKKKAALLSGERGQKALSPGFMENHVGARLGDDVGARHALPLQKKYEPRIPRV